MDRTNGKPLEGSGTACASASAMTPTCESSSIAQQLSPHFADGYDPQRMSTAEIETMAGFVSALLQKS